MIQVKKGDLIKCRYVTRWGEIKGAYLARVLLYKERRNAPIYLEAILSFVDGSRIDGHSDERHFQIQDNEVHKNFGDINIHSLEEFEEEYPEWAI